MKYPAGGFSSMIGDLPSVHNGTPTDSAHAHFVDAYTTYLEATAKYLIPVHIGAPMSQIGEYVEHILPVQAYPGSVGVNFLCTGQGYILIKDSSATYDAYRARLDVEGIDAGFHLYENAEWFCLGGALTAVHAHDQNRSLDVGSIGSRIREYPIAFRIYGSALRVHAVQFVINPWNEAAGELPEST